MFRMMTRHGTDLILWTNQSARDQRSSNQIAYIWHRHDHGTASPYSHTKLALCLSITRFCRPLGKAVSAIVSWLIPCLPSWFNRCCSHLWTKPDENLQVRRQTDTPINRGAQTTCGEWLQAIYRSRHVITILYMAVLLISTARTTDQATSNAFTRNDQ